ncbi:MAG TPA: 1-(5-phosphoribosyl)-5-[(5-phosphoribosylamino)methylideneamino] imidazole-4-carboxamide isomerase [Thermotogota bacterium]|nr:1-(5-phosphoribosyl)-5-[(5-phosphoribosylamino)methylideneamino] imidazole-4-carboxamide isomerase [Thermotogota bacterium]
MKIFPAIDLMDGRAVRLLRGKKEQRKDYGDPVELARGFAPYIAELHVVDLDGAFQGSPQNLHTVERIKRHTGLSIQLGGGLRSAQHVRQALDAGADRVILGTRVLEQPSIVDEWTELFGARIVVSLDFALDPSGKPRLLSEGWQKLSELGLGATFERLKGKASRFILTNTTQDGTLQGAHPPEGDWRGVPVLYAGGVSSMEDLDKVYRAGFWGVISGKALLEGNLDLAAALERFCQEEE